MIICFSIQPQHGPMCSPYSYGMVSPFAVSYRLLYSMSPIIDGDDVGPYRSCTVMMWDRTVAVW